MVRQGGFKTTTGSPADEGDRLMLSRILRTRATAVHSRSRRSAAFFAAMVVILVLAFASTAFAYTSVITLPSNTWTGIQLDTTWTWTKALGDTPVIGDGVNSGTWQKIVILNTPVANVSSTANWSNSPWQDGNGSAVFESQYSPWVGNNWKHVSPLNIKFLTPGVYTVQIGLTDDSIGSGGWLPGSMTTRTINVVPPVVGTPASSPWSLAIVGILGLGVIAVAGWKSRSAA
jgi:hypothetical protein